MKISTGIINILIAIHSFCLMAYIFFFSDLPKIEDSPEVKNLIVFMTSILYLIIAGAFLWVRTHKKAQLILKKIFFWEICVVSSTSIILLISALIFSYILVIEVKRDILFATAPPIIIGLMGFGAIASKFKMNENKYFNTLIQNELIYTIQCRDLNHPISFQSKKEKEKEKELKNRRIIIGYGLIGKEMIDEIFRHKTSKHNDQKKVKNKNKKKDKDNDSIETNWKNEKIILKNIIVVEKDELKVPHVVGEFNSIGKIGYISYPNPYKEKKNQPEEFIIPVLIADCRSCYVQDLLHFSEVKTITFTSMSFRSNLSILDIWNQSINSNPTNEIKTSTIIACRSHAERETYQQRLIDNNIYPHSVIQASEHVGTTLANLIRTKLDYQRETGRDEEKILFCGNSFLYSIIESLYANNYFDPPYQSKRKCNLLVMDSETGGQLYYAPPKKNILTLFPDFPSQSESFDFSRIRKLSVWRPSFCCFLKDNIGDYNNPQNIQINIPVIKEEPKNIMVSILKNWKPSLIVVLNRRKEDMEKILNLILCHTRWNKLKRNSPGNYDIIVSATGSDSQIEAIDILEKNLYIPYGVYSSSSEISRELMLLERMSGSLNHNS